MAILSHKYYTYSLHYFLVSMELFRVLIAYKTGKKSSRTQQYGKCGGFWTEGISGHLEFNSSFLNETKANLVATHAQIRTPYWLPIVIVFSS